MHLTVKTLWPFPAAALFAVAGCFSLGRDTPPLAQYVLGATHPQTVGPAPAERAGLTLGMRRLDLAAYLATPSIVVRRGAHQVVVSEFHRWGEDLAAGISRAVAGYLAAGEAIRAVDVAPWSVRSQHDFLMQLHVARFEGVAPEEAMATEGEARMLAVWEILGPPGGAVLARGSTDYTARGWRVGDYGALVTLLDTGLQDVARDLADCIGRLAAVSASDPRSVVPAPPLACGHATE